MLRNYLKIAFRNLWKNKIYSVINIFGLGLGMATSVLLFLWVQNELSYDSFHEKSDNIYRLNSHLKMDESETLHWANTPFELAESLKAIAPEIQEVTRLYVPYGAYTLKIRNENSDKNKIGFVDANWFDVFDYQFVVGNSKDFSNDKFNVAITESKAKLFFGNIDPIGKIIQHDSLNFVVQAIMKDLPSNSSFQFEILAQNAARLVNPKDFADDSNWDNFNYQTYILCNSGINIQSVSNKFTKLLSKLREDKENKTTLELQPLGALHFDNTIQAEGLTPTADTSVLYIFSIIGVFILLIACINYVNLTTAKASQRTKEVSVKKMIGASNKSLFYQFFIESIITSFISASVAIILVFYGISILENLSDNHFSFRENQSIWYILVSITLVSVALTGIYPSILIASIKPINLLKGSNIGGTRNDVFRKALVVFQFTFTIVLLTGNLLIYRQLKFIQNKDLGYSKEHIFTVVIPRNVKNGTVIQQSLIDKLKKESSIQDVTMSNEKIVDTQSSNGGTINWPGKDPKLSPVLSQMAITDNF